MTNKNNLAPRLDTALNPPHGGVLKELYLPPDEAAAAKQRSAALLGWDLTPRQLCDLELLLNGAFSPLGGFLDQRDYAAVLERTRLADGSLWPIPIVLDVSEEFAARLEPGDEIALRDVQGVPLALMSVTELYRPDLAREAEQVFGTLDPAHPGVDELLHRTRPVYVGGPVRGIQAPAHYDFPELRHSPAALRAELELRGWEDVVAFQTRNPMHRAHHELTLRAARHGGARLLIQPVVGRSKPGDVDHYTRVRCYRAVMAHYPKDTALLSLLPLAMRMAGPREALWHAIIRKNYGASQFIVGRDHAGPGNDAQGRAFYPPYAAQELVARHQRELGIRVVPFPAMVYAANRDAYLPANELHPEDEARDLSGTELRNLLRNGEPIPPWFTFPEVATILRERYPVQARRGFALFFTGLSGAGKSTLAEAVLAQLLALGSRPVTLLDGDEVRKHLSRGLGFSRADRAANVTRIGYVASEVVKHGGIAICAPIAPHADARAEVRGLVAAQGEFVEIHVATPIEVCEARDRKGLYAQARAGKITQFTGVSDPYEVPEGPELTFDTSAAEPLAIARQILAYLRNRGLLGDG